MKNNQTEQNVDRRDFLVQAGVGALGALALTLGMSPKEAVAQARLAKKPLLTEKTANDMLKTDGFRRNSSTMTGDLKGFLRENFALTPVQDRNLEGTPSETLEKFGKALQYASDTGTPINVNFRRGGGIELPPININLTINC